MSQLDLRKPNTDINKHTCTSNFYFIKKKIARNCKFKLFNTEFKERDLKSLCCQGAYPHL